MFKVKADIFSGLVVFLIALPLCLGIALASGAPTLISGLIAGIVGGIVVSLFSSSHVSVSGPAAGLTIVVFDAIHHLGSFERLLAATVIAGLIQICFGLFKFGFLANYVPTSVIKGMLVAIGIVIVVKQIPHALGRDLDYEGDFSFFGGDFYGNSANELIESVLGLKPGATTITIISLFILIAWPKLKVIPQSLKVIPASLLAVVFAILTNQIFKTYFPDLYLNNLDGHRVNVPQNLNSVASISLALSSPDFSAFYNGNVLITALIIASIASIETLLSLEAADKLDSRRRISDPNRELFAQGIGNIMSGLLGGLPITSVVLRTSANINAGAETRYSSFFHGVFLLLSVIFLPTLLNEIPLSALAAILIVVGYKLCSVEKFVEEWRLGSVQFFPFIVTVLAVVFTDLLSGVIIGFIVGLFFVLRSTHRPSFTSVADENHHLIRFNKDVSFLNKTELKDKLAKIPANSVLILDGTKAMIIDHDIKDLLRDFVRLAKFKNINIEIRHISGII